MEVTIDGFTFSLSEGSNTIYVFKGDAYVTNHFCITHDRALRIFEDIKTKKYVLFKGEDEYEIKKNKEYKKYETGQSTNSTSVSK